jgi:hypothetical protein
VVPCLQASHQNSVCIYVPKQCLADSLLCKLHDKVLVPSGIRRISNSGNPNSFCMNKTLYENTGNIPGVKWRQMSWCVSLTHCEIDWKANICTWWVCTVLSFSRLVGQTCAWKMFLLWREYLSSTELPGRRENL